MKIGDKVAIIPTRNLHQRYVERLGVGIVRKVTAHRVVVVFDVGLRVMKASSLKVASG